MKSLLKLSLLLSFVFAFTACGGGGETTETATPEPEVMDDGVRTIEIFGTDDMRFAVAEAGEGLATEGMSKGYMILTAIEAAPGEELRITLKPKVCFLRQQCLTTGLCWLSAPILTALRGRPLLRGTMVIFHRIMQIR